MEVVMSRPAVRPKPSSARSPSRGDAQVNIRGVPDELVKRVDAWVEKVNAQQREPFSKNAVLRAALEWLVENEPDVMKK